MLEFSFFLSPEQDAPFRGLPSDQASIFLIGPITGKLMEEFASKSSMLKKQTVRPYCLFSRNTHR